MTRVKPIPPASPFARKPFGGLNANWLRTLAMVFMLLDHLWASLVPGNAWMTFVGRMAFPIFAFQISEGFFHTGDRRRYWTRLLLFGLISEIPFNFLQAGSPIFPFHQNVMFTLLLGLTAISALDRARAERTGRGWVRGISILLATLLLAAAGFVDYGPMGVLTVVLFYLLRGFPGAWLAQLAAMVLLHIVLFEGMYLPLTLFGHTFAFETQGFAVLALIPIWLYNGRHGRSSKALQYAYYAFYPVHQLVLYLILILFP